ncbi:MAG: endo-1,4-beta-xylanase [Spirochaetales bacterium]|nr:endo-1,4-beta-xylanase [Spirochaetales bacterium]
MGKKRKVISVIVLAVLLLGGLSVTASAQSLKSLSKQLRDLGREFYIGAAVPSNLGGSDQNIVTTEFDIMTCENDMKIGTISPNRGQYNYSGGDRVVNLARQNNMLVHGHAFVWHKYNPGWVDGTKSMMEEYITAVGNHFKGQIWGWDVVNEAFHRDGTFRINAIGSNGQDGASVFGQRQGKQYIEDAFKIAHRVDPNARLIYNDYSISTLDAKFNGMYTAMKDYMQRGIPITGVGFQMHLNPDFTEAMARSFGEKLQKLADIGLESYITEMDGGAPNTSTSGLEAQGDIYYWITKVALDQPMFKVLQVWGIRDSQNWRINPDAPEDKAVAPLIFNDNGQKKPAYYGIQRAMQEKIEELSETPTPTPVPTAEPFDLGDCNHDNAINIVDALLIAQNYVSLPVQNFYQESADVNCNGAVDIVDALLIAQYYVNLVPAFQC